MRFQKTTLYAISLLTLGCIEIHAQETVPASGGNALGSGGTVTYSVGQVTYTTNDGGANGSVAQGVQQPYEISVVPVQESTKGINLSAYPNPTTDYLMLKVDINSSEKLTYQLFDISGKLLENKKIKGNEISIFMCDLVPATYFLKVFQENKEVKSFKIIKN